MSDATLTREPTSAPSWKVLRSGAQLTAGFPVGEYEIQAQIGEGAMGTVYSAVHPLIGKTVAIKVLKAELCSNQASIDRFVQEAQSVNRIGHPNIVDVFSLGELPDGRHYFVMEWLRGEDLKAWLARGPITVADACEILDGVARALVAAHEKDIVHRDLKPDNIYLHQVPNGPLMVKLLDFGIAKLMRSQMTMEKTQTGNMLGTPRYISPEQARGIRVDHRSDIYSLGVIAYEMLAGRPPFEGETGMDLVVKHLNEPAPPLSQFARVPAALETCVMRMLEKDPEQRPSLESVRHVLADPTSRQAPAQRVARRWPLWAFAGFAVASLGAIAWWQHTDAELAPAPATTQLPPPSPTPAPMPRQDEPAARTVEPSRPAPVGRGTLIVHVIGSVPAVILVDKQEWGRGAALTVKVELDAGSHEIEVRPRGRDPITQQVDIDAGRASTVKITVPALAAPRPPAHPVAKPAPPPAPAPPVPGDDDLLQPKRHP